MAISKRKLALLASLPIFALGVSVAQDGDGKILSKAEQLKAALAAAGVESTSAGIDEMADAADEFKIAALDTDEIKEGLEAVPGDTTLIGDFVQGGLIIGSTIPGATITLDGERLDVDEEGNFIFGFGRDHGPVAWLNITHADGSVVPAKELKVEDRDFPEQAINGLDSSKVNQYTAEQLEKIKKGVELKNAARANMQKQADWQSRFEWPVTGPISGVFGSRRILNGVPKRPHSGVDIAAPTGTPVVAPADGIVTLAEDDMYFEGGLVFIDHGQGLESALMHMSSVDVEVGQRLKRGEVIGAVGATGRATGPHMHWSLKWRNRLLDAQLVVPEMQ